MFNWLNNVFFPHELKKIAHRIYSLERMQRKKRKRVIVLVVI